MGDKMSFLDLFKSKKNREETNVLPDTLQRSFGFPETDESGKKALVLREADIYGVGRTYSKIAAQDVISKLNIGDPVLLKRSEASDAVKVYSSQGEQFGFLPEWKDINTPKVKYEVYSSLERGATVLAKVKNKYRNKNGSIGIVIEICRYSAR